jgi:hypothetical protein
VLVAAIAMLLLGAPGPSGDPVALSWTAPEACPSPAAGRERVESFLGVPLDRASSRGPLSIEVSITPGTTGFEASIGFGEDGSRRSLVDGDCEVLSDAAAFVVASNIDPRVLDTELEPEEAQPQPEPQPELEAPKPGPEPEPDPRLRVGLAASLLATVRPMLVSGVGPGPALRFALLVGRARIELEGFGAVGQRHFVPDTPTSLRASAVGGSLRGCFAALARPRVELPICAGFEAAAEAAHALRGIIEPRAGWQPWLAIVAGAGGIWRITPRVGLGGGVDLAIAARRPAFSVVNQGTAFSPFPVAVTPWIAVELRSR